MRIAYLATLLALSLQALGVITPRCNYHLQWNMGYDYIPGQSAWKATGKLTDKSTNTDVCKQGTVWRLDGREQGNHWEYSCDGGVSLLIDGKENAKATLTLPNGRVVQFKLNVRRHEMDCACTPIGKEGEVCTPGCDIYEVDQDLMCPIFVPPAETRVMVVGDSISHGMEGDWTWRWRIYAWLEQIGYNPRFVGPNSGTHGLTIPSAAKPKPPRFPGESVPDPPYVYGRYASGVPSGFQQSGHASFWGRQAAQTKDTIQGWVEQYQPEYIFLLLGFNDLGWWVSDADGLLKTMQQLIENARKGKPDVKILLGNVVHRKFIGGRQDLVDQTQKYNQLLMDTYQSWSRPESRIEYIDMWNYNCRPDACPDGYDGLHPNSMGEYHIAEAFARTLSNAFQFEGPDFVVPASAEPRVVSTPTNVKVISMPEGLYTIWDWMPNARGYDIRSRLKGMTDWWNDGQTSTIASWNTWLIDGQTWESQVRTRGDNDDRSNWSPIVTETAHLQTSPGPKNIVVVPKGDGIQFSWQAVTGYDVNRYGVIIWDRDTPGSYIGIYAASGTTFFVGGLVAGHRYSTWVATWTNLNGGIAGGMPTAGREVYISGGAPAPPTNVRVTNIDPTSVRVTWDASAGASGYAVYFRSVKDNAAFDKGSPTSETNYGIAYMYPGTWNFEICVSAYNGNLETAHTACVIPPRYPGYRKRDGVIGNSTVPAAIVTNTSAVYDTATMMLDDRLPELYQQFLLKAVENSSVPLF